MKSIVQKIYIFSMAFVSTEITLAQVEVNKIFPSSQGKYVTYSSSTSFCDFSDYISFLYSKYDKKRININGNCSFPIGLELNNIFYKKCPGGSFKNK